MKNNLKKNNKFELVSNWPPAGDQPKAISELVKGLEKENLEKQTLLGVTGSGKTFTIANVISQIQKPTLVIAHNKTLAAQLAQEFKEFFPNNKVHYFVSYYDYYQPEAYVSATDTYIEKDASINEEIDRLRHASTQSLLTRNDVIIVASVSCIYGLGSPEEYFKENLLLEVGQKYDKLSLMEKLVSLHFTRTNADLKNGTFRAVGNRVDINPMSENWMASIFFSNGKISMIQILDPVSMKLLEEVNEVMFFPAKHFVTSEETMKKALLNIEKELNDQVKIFESEGKLLEADRIKRRTMQDIAMMREVGYCSGIENYSRHLSGKKEGEAPETLMSYFPKNEKGERDFLTIIDESHVTLPQLSAMYAGDRSRKENLVKHGFRLPSALDNRPLRYEEFTKKVGQIIYVSATPSEREIIESKKVVEQIIRPTGLIDPELVVRPVLPRKKRTSLIPNPSPSERGIEQFKLQTANLYKYDELKMNAKDFRKNQTEAEELLWQNLRNNKLGFKFRRQHAIDNFIVDFFCLSEKLIVEVDGGIHDFQKEKDEERTKILENLGFKIIRFSNQEILYNLKNVLDKISLELENKVGIEVLSGGEDLGEAKKVLIYIPGMSKTDEDFKIELEKYSKENNFDLHIFSSWKNEKDLQEKSFKEIKENFDKFYSGIRRENHKSLSEGEGLSGAKYYLIAKSFGGLFSLLYDLFDFEKVILWAPAGGIAEFSNLRKIENLQLKNILNIDDIKISLKNLQKIKNKTKQVCLIVGTNDKVIKFENQKIISENIQKSEYFEIEGMGHSSKNAEESKILLDKTFEFLIKSSNLDIKNKNLVGETLSFGEGASSSERVRVNENYPGQIEDFIKEVETEVKKGGRVLCTTLTKKMAEDLSNFLKDRKIKAEYMHSDVKTLERIQILTKFRRGEFDCLVGVNLLREGLDLPEVSLIGILDADKEGFLRSETSLIQTIGRAARNVDGRVILYADVMTGSMEKAINETNRRRKIQEEYNTKNNITPKTILKSINDITKGMESIHKKAAESALDTEIKLGGKKLSTILNQKEKEMKMAAKDLDFETAAIIRDEIKKLQKMIEDKKDKSDKKDKK